MHDDPKTRRARLEQALALERDGRQVEALEAIEALVAEARDSPKLLAHYGRSLLAAGRIGDAQQAVGDALELWPTDAALHALFAEIRWQHGSGEAALDLLERAIAGHPDAAPLRLVAADLLRNLGHAPRALELLEAGLARAPGSAALLSSVGVVLDDLDRPHDALPYLRAAIARAQEPLRHLANLVPVLLRTGAAAEALAACDELARVLPDEQRLIAYRSTALRLLGDARYAPLCDYARLVRCYRLEPAGRGIAGFNAEFAGELRRLHRAVRRPIAQTLRGGTQTEQHLPAGNPLVAEFFAMLEAPIRDYVSRLDRERGHPVDRRRRAGYRIAGSWSVRLAPGGFHVDHVHPQGWLSSAYYVELPHAGADADASRAGWLKFGEPGVRVGLAPEHFVKPEAGMLVLFPSYFWHGTVPFSDGGDRLTAAFDVVPD